jgi:tetratricopeptide (TPR) repeat protein
MAAASPEWIYIDWEAHELNLRVPFIPNEPAASLAARAVRELPTEGPKLLGPNDRVLVSWQGIEPPRGKKPADGEPFFTDSARVRMSAYPRRGDAQMKVVPLVTEDAPLLLFAHEVAAASPVAPAVDGLPAYYRIPANAFPPIATIEWTLEAPPVALDAAGFALPAAVADGLGKHAKLRMFVREPAAPQSGPAAAAGEDGSLLVYEVMLGSKKDRKLTTLPSSGEFFFVRKPAKEKEDATAAAVDLTDPAVLRSEMRAGEELVRKGRIGAGIAKLRPIAAALEKLYVTTADDAAARKNVVEVMASVWGGLADLYRMHAKKPLVAAGFYQKLFGLYRDIAKSRDPIIPDANAVATRALMYANQFADMLHEAGSYRQAISFIQEVLELVPPVGKVFAKAPANAVRDLKIRLGGALFMEDRKMEGMRLVQDSLGGDTSCEIGLYWMTQFYCEQNLHFEALQWAMQLLVRNTKNERYQKLFADMVRRAPDGVDLLMTRVLRDLKTPQHISVWSFLAQSLRDQGCLAEARRLYLRAMDITPLNANVALCAAHLMENEGDLVGALRYIQTFLRTYDEKKLARSKGLLGVDANLGPTPAQVADMIGEVPSGASGMACAALVKGTTAYVRCREIPASEVPKAAKAPKPEKKDKPPKADKDKAKKKEAAAKDVIQSTIYDPEAEGFQLSVLPAPGATHYVFTPGDPSGYPMGDSSSSDDDAAAVDPTDAAAVERQKEKTQRREQRKAAAEGRGAKDYPNSTKRLDSNDLSVVAMYFTAAKLLHLLGALDRLPALVHAVNALRIQDPNLHLTSARNEQSYFTTVLLALQYLDPPATRELTSAATSGTKSTLYWVGDSHAVPAAWHVLFATPPSPAASAAAATAAVATPRLIVPRLVTGIKVWHLRPESNFYPKAQFWATMPHIPRGADVLFNIGEIDFREGIIGAVERGMYSTRDDCALALSKLYLDVVLDVKRQRQLRRIFILGPLPVLEFTRHLVVAGNRVWKKFFDENVDARREEIVYMDVCDQVLCMPEKNPSGTRSAFAMMEGEMRVLRNEFNFDATHISPSVLTKVLEPLLREYYTVTF